jgi:hypothetical protein
MGVRWDEWLIRSEGTGLTLMIAHAKFCTGILLHNRNTKEDGLVTKVNHSAELGETMYQVAVSIRPDTWAGRHLVSDWAESTLEPSDNAMLKASDKPIELRPSRGAFRAGLFLVE